MSPSFKSLAATLILLPTSSPRASGLAQRIAEATVLDMHYKACVNWRQSSREDDQAEVLGYYIWDSTSTAVVELYPFFNTSLIEDPV